MIWIPVSWQLFEKRELLPVKFRPKTSSSGGSKALGVVVFVMLSFEGSIP
jgi:hypothetical protein